MPSGLSRTDGRSMYADLKELIAFLPDRRMKELRGLLWLSVLGAFAEVLTIGALVPYIAVLTSDAENSPLLIVRKMVGWLSALPGISLFASATILMVTAAIVATAVKISRFRLSQRLIFRSSHDVSTMVFARALSQNYTFHVSSNSAAVLATTAKIKSVTMRAISPLVQLMTQIVAAIMLLIVVVLLHPVVAISAIVGLGAIYIIISKLVTERLRGSSAAISRIQKKRVQLMQEALGSIRDLSLNRAHQFYIDRFNQLDGALHEARSSTSIVSSVPRYCVELMAILAIIAAVFYFSQDTGSLTAALPILAALILGLQRLIPVIQSCYSSWVGMKENHHSLLDVLAILQLPEDASATIGADDQLKFEGTIQFDDVSYHYPERDSATIENLSITIPKGARIGIVGRTGSGKTTFLNLFMGLLAPTSGKFRIDGVEVDQSNLSRWQAHVAHVGQEVYLTDDTIGRNIAFCTSDDEIDHNRLEGVVNSALVRDFIEQLPNGVDSVVGENGIRLSGGQKQRIAIARALYRKADVLVLDETTSALDMQTEQDLLKSIQALDPSITILMTAHRRSAIDWCDEIYNVENGQIGLITSQFRQDLYGK